MSEGTIKRLTDKGFGFIANEKGKDLFFHMSAVEGCRFEELREGQAVTFNEGVGPKGPRAENVRVVG
jgi:cold shock protein